MRIYRVAILPIGGRFEEFQTRLNSMIEELFTEGWEFSGLSTLTSREIVASFFREKDGPSKEETEKSAREKEIEKLQLEIDRLKSEPKNDQ